MNSFKVFIAFIVFALLAIFSIQNAAIVDIQFFHWHMSLPRAVMVLVLVMAGFLLGILTSNIARLRKSKNQSWKL